MDVASETEILEIKKLLGLSKIFLANIIGFSWNFEHNSAWQCDWIWSNFTKNRRLSIKLGQKSRFLGLFSPQKQFSRIRRFFIKKCTNVNYGVTNVNYGKTAFGAKIIPKNDFSANISIFHEIRPDSSIALPARCVCKISGKSDLIWQK